MLPQKNELKLSLVIFTLGIGAGMLIMLGLQHSKQPQTPQHTKSNTELVSPLNTGTPQMTLGNEQFLEQIRDVVRQTLALELAAIAANKEITAVAESPAQAGDPQPNSDAYQLLMQRIKDPAFNQTLTMEQLLGMPEVQHLPQAQRERLLGETALMLSSGELDPQRFLSR